MTDRRMDEEKRWDDKTRTLVASLEALLRLHRERESKPPAAAGEAQEPTPQESRVTKG